MTVRAGAASATVNVIIDDKARNGWYEENGKHYWYVDGERQGLQKGGDLDEQDSATLKAWSGFETALDEFEDVLYLSLIHILFTKAVSPGCCS